MMSWFSLAFETVVAGLLIAMLVYAVKLNRRLMALRDRDAEIRDMIGLFNTAADQANASAANLKAAGLEAEHSLRIAIAGAQTLCEELGRKTGAIPRRATAAPAGTAPGSARPPAVIRKLDNFPTVAEILGTRNEQKNVAAGDRNMPAEEDASPRASAKTLLRTMRSVKAGG